jgi:hypothetical protein
MVTINVKPVLEQSYKNKAREAEASDFSRLQEVFFLENERYYR